MGQALLEPILEGIGHGDELDVGVGGERLGGRAGAPVAAADQADPENVAAGRVDRGQRWPVSQRRPWPAETHAGTLIVES